MRRSKRAAASAGEWFAKMVELEAASVVAFKELADELRAHGAPARLVRSAKRSAADERRHTRAMTALARRFGGNPRAKRIRAAQLRSLEQIAIENAREGCVRETVGALLATWQAAHSSDAHVRSAMATIAKDETRHAALSWRIHAWALETLSRREASRVREAMASELATIRGELSAETARSMSEAIGLPAPAEAIAAFDSLAARLFARSAAGTRRSR